MFDNLKQRYDWGWVRINQLKMYVVLKEITADEYKIICGQEYEQ